jgi:hypothetical protein
MTIAELPKGPRISEGIAFFSWYLVKIRFLSLKLVHGGTTGGKTELHRAYSFA